MPILMIALMALAVFGVIGGLLTAAVVLEIRDPEFARTAETVARAAGLLASFQIDLRRSPGHRSVLP